MPRIGAPLDGEGGAKRGWGEGAELVEDLSLEEPPPLTPPREGEGDSRLALNNADYRDRDGFLDRTRGAELLAPRFFGRADILALFAA